MITVITVYTYAGRPFPVNSYYLCCTLYKYRESEKKLMRSSLSVLPHTIVHYHAKRTTFIRDYSASSYLHFKNTKAQIHPS